MAVDENSLVLESNAMALRLFRPLEHDPPLNFLLPLVQDPHIERVKQAFDSARSSTCEPPVGLPVWIERGLHRRPAHGADRNPHDELAHFICAIIDQGPLLAERRALQASAAALAAGAMRSCSSRARPAGRDHQTARWTRFTCVDAGTQLIDDLQFHGGSRTVPVPTRAGPGQRTRRAFLARRGADAGLHPALHPVRSWARWTGLSASGKALAVEVSVSFEHGPDGDTIDRLRARPDSARRRSRRAHQCAGGPAARVAEDAGGGHHGRRRRRTTSTDILGAILGNVGAGPAGRGRAVRHGAGEPARDREGQVGARATWCARSWHLQPQRNRPKRRRHAPGRGGSRERRGCSRSPCHPRWSCRCPSIPAHHPCWPTPPRLNKLCSTSAPTPSRRWAIGDGTIAHRAQTPAATCCVAHPMGAVSHVGPMCGCLSATPAAASIRPRLSGSLNRSSRRKPVGQGTGLGLAVVHGIMRTNEGTVEVQSAPGAGSVFTLFFPALPSGAIVATPAGAAQCTRGGGRRTTRDVRR